MTFDDMKLISNTPIKEVDCSEILKNAKKDVRSYNVGDSDYSKHKIQPWDLWIDYQLNPFDADIVKRVLRHKKSQSRKEEENKEEEKKEEEKKEEEKKEEEKKDEEKKEEEKKEEE